MTLDVQAEARKRRRRPRLASSIGVPLVMNRDEVAVLLPHRPPFLLIDGMLRLDAAQRRGVARYRIDPHDPVLAGHFPNDPVYPGVLLVESIAQGCLCLARLCGAPAGSVRLTRILDASFMAAVRPGDELLLLVEELDDTGLTRVCAGQAVRNGEVCASAVLEVLVIDPAAEGPRQGEGSSHAIP